MLGPRTRREKYERWVGRKVVVGLKSLHYLCGRLTAVDDEQATFAVRFDQHRVPLAEIASIAAAPDVEAEFFK